MPKRVRLKHVAGQFEAFAAYRQRATEGISMADTIADRIIDPAFAAQKAFADDPARFLAAFCTRRAGKSQAIGRIFYRDALRFPGTQQTYVGLTRASAKAIMWEPIFKKLNDEFKIGPVDMFNNTDLTIHIPNGSLLRIVGADANDSERHKLLGQKNLRVAVDECASFKPHIRPLINDVLRPTLMDLRGQLIQAGSPGEVATGMFYDITTGKLPGWSVHKWSTADNPYMAKQFAEELAQLRAEDPLIHTRPWFRRQYMAEWVTDADNLVYAFVADGGVFDTIPQKRARYVISCDLGWEDATAFTVAGWVRNDPTLYIVESWKRQKMTFDDVAAQVRDLLTIYPDTLDVVVDNANKQGVESMRQRHGINFIAAEKTDKLSHIGLMNSDMAAGRVKVASTKCDDLLAEWANLIWDASSIAKREDPRCENHCADSALYAWRHARNYQERQVTTETPEESEIRRMEEAAMEHIRQKGVWER